MKRSILFSVVGVAAIVAAFAGHSAFAANRSTVMVADLGDACTGANGRSGYMVSTGRGEVCSADDESPTGPTG